MDAIRIDGLLGRTSIQCFDWEVLRQVGEVEPALRRNVLASDKNLQPGRAGASPWLGGLDVDDFAGGQLSRTPADPLPAWHDRVP